MEKLGELRDEFVNKIVTLDDLWKEVNYYEEEDCNQNISDLKEKILALLDDRIRISLEKKNQLIEEISKFSKEILIISERLELENQLASVNEEKNLVTKLTFVKKTLQSLKEEEETRINKLKKLKEDLNAVLEELNVRIEKIFPDISKYNHSSLSLNLISFYEHCLQQSSIQLKSLKEKILFVKQEIRILFEELRYSEDQKNDIDKFAQSPQSLFPLPKKLNNKIENNNDQPISDYQERLEAFHSLQDTVTLLEKRKNELEAALRRLKDAVRELLPRIMDLWVELAVPLNDLNRLRLWSYLLPKNSSPSIEDQQNYLKALLNYDPSIPNRFPMSIIQSCEAEYERLMKIKAEKYKILIERERKKLRKLWDELHFGEEQRLSFIPGHCEEYNEEILQAVIDEVKRLTELLEAMKPLLQQIERREWIKEEMKRFEHTASDPNRFKGNSTRLLQEEKFRKIVSKEFPKLTKGLKKSLTLWQKNHGGEAFYYDGEPYIETMEKEQCNPNFELLHLRLLVNSKTEVDGGSADHLKSPLIHAVSQGKSKGHYTTPASEGKAKVAPKATLSPSSKSTVARKPDPPKTPQKTVNKK